MRANNIRCGIQTRCLTNIYKRDSDDTIMGGGKFTENPEDVFMCLPDKMHKFFKIVTTKYLVNTQIKNYHIPFIIFFGYNPGASQKDIASYLPIDKSRVSTVIRELINLGIIVNESEGRLTSIRLTENGNNLFAMSKMLQEILHNSLFADFTEEEIRQFSEMAHRLDSKMDAILEKAESDKTTPL